MGMMIEEEILRAAHISGAELKQEIAVLLFQQDRLTLGQSAHLAEMNQLRFQHLLASRGIPVHYTVDDFEDDITALKKLGRL